ncbi:MAG: HemK/PrmC family methyltransferase, partial [Minisyncoccia bacterium]
MTQSKLPEAYEIGWIPFIHTDIYLDSRPLIPRPETEYWVDLAIKEIEGKGIEQPKILDLCAGSGCIGISVLKEIPNALVDFVEIDKAHHQTIRKNILMNNLDPDRVRIFDGDLFEKVIDSYDFILCNPPYIDPKLKGRIQSSVIEHEPHEALFGGEGGVIFIDTVLTQYRDYLNPDGMLYIEHEPEQAKTLESYLRYLNTGKDQ